MAVIANVTAGQYITEAWGDSVADEINGYSVIATYTPTLTGMAIGSGGSPANSAAYLFQGQRHVTAVGMIMAWGTVVFGTTGPTFPTAPTISLPAGFQFSSTSPMGIAQRNIGYATLNDSGTEEFYGACAWATTTTFGIRALRLTSTVFTGTVQAYVHRTALSTTVPMTWAAGDGIYWMIQAPAVRV